MGIFQNILGVFTNRFLVGRGRAEDISILAWLSGSQKPGFRYDYASGKWKYSNDGINWNDMGASAPVVIAPTPVYPQWLIPPAIKINVGEYQQYAVHNNRLVVEGGLSLSAGSQLIVGIAGMDATFQNMLTED